MTREIILFSRNIISRFQVIFYPMMTCIKEYNLRNVQCLISTKRPFPSIKIRLSHHHLIFIMEMSTLLRQHLYHATAPGGSPKNFWGGCAARVFDRIPLAKEILVENIPLTKENFLIMSPFLHDFKEFQPKYSLFKINFLKTDTTLAPKCHFFRVFLSKIYPWLRTSDEKYILT